MDPTCKRVEVQSAVQKCPFLSALADREGVSFACHVATHPNRPFSNHRGPIFEEGVGEFESTIQLFHGSSGLVPLARFCTANPTLATPIAASQRCTSSATSSTPALSSECTLPLDRNSRTSQRRGIRPLTSSPAASISLSFGFLPGPDDIFRALQRNFSKPKRRPVDGKGPKNTGSKPSAAKGSTISTVAHTAAAQPAPGRCPLRGIIEPIGGLIALGKTGQLKCPTAIIQMRAAVARMKPVRELRPRALPIKLAAIGMAGGLVNMPFGMWREHLEKFSPGWFVAVHATIPFIAVLRKAVIMPKWAIIATIASAVAGQIIGGRIERYRLSLSALDGPAKQHGASTLAAPLVTDALTERGAKQSMSVSCAQQAALPFAAGFLHSGVLSRV